MGGSLLKLRAWWETADRTTKTVTFVGGGLLVALLMGVFYMAGAPDMKLLYGGLDPTEQGRVIQKLQEMKIPYKQEIDGSIMVPGHQVAEARARLAQEGVPALGAIGNGWLDKTGMTDSTSVQDQKMLLALEGEMQKTIEFMAPVAAAKVHISPAGDSPFLSDRSESSASVVVQLRPSQSSSRDVASAIVHTLTGGVRGLKPQNISVADSNGVVIWDGRSDETGTAVAGKKREAELAEAQRLEHQIERMIAQAVGPGKAVVSASVEMNFDKEEVTTRSHTPTKEPLSSESVTERMGPGAAGPGGPASITAAPAVPGATGADGGYEMTHEVKNAGVIESHSERNVAPGGLLAARVSIMLDESAAAQRQQITAFANNLIGTAIDPERFSVAVTTVPFDTTAAEAATAQLASARSGQTMQQVVSLLPILALLIVGFMVMKAIGKAATSNRNVVLTAGALPSAYAPAALSAPRPTASTQNAQQAAPATEQALPSLSDAARARADAIKSTMRPDVEDIPEKFDVNLEQILRMADTRPESVALLVKTWLLEETN